MTEMRHDFALAAEMTVDALHEHARGAITHLEHTVELLDLGDEAGASRSFRKAGLYFGAALADFQDWKRLQAGEGAR